MKHSLLSTLSSFDLCFSRAMAESVEDHVWFNDQSKAISILQSSNSISLTGSRGQGVSQLPLGKRGGTPRMSCRR